MLGQFCVSFPWLFVIALSYKVVIVKYHPVRAFVINGINEMDDVNHAGLGMRTCAKTAPARRYK